MEGLSFSLHLPVSLYTPSFRLYTVFLFVSFLSLWHTHANSCAMSKIESWATRFVLYNKDSAMPIPRFLLPIQLRMWISSAWKFIVSINFDSALRRFLSISNSISNSRYSEGLDLYNFLWFVFGWTNLKIYISWILRSISLTSNRQIYGEHLLDNVLVRSSDWLPLS